MGNARISDVLLALEVQDAFRLGRPLTEEERAALPDRVRAMAVEVRKAEQKRRHLEALKKPRVPVAERRSTAKKKRALEKAGRKAARK